MKPSFIITKLPSLTTGWGLAGTETIAGDSTGALGESYKNYSLTLLLRVIVRFNCKKTSI